MSYVWNAPRNAIEELTEANYITRLSRAKKLLSKFPKSAVDFIFFTDEKVFTVAPPVNLQNKNCNVDKICDTTTLDLNN